MFLELEKIKQVTSYLAGEIPELYVTKFLKLLYYLDFISVLERGVPVTNDTYYHLPYGPVPTVIKDQISILRKENRSEDAKLISADATVDNACDSIFKNFVEIEKIGEGYIIKNIVSLELNYLSEYEKGLLGDIVLEFKKISAKDIVEKTHLEIPYIQTPPNNVIDYKLAFYLDRKTILPKRIYQYNPEISQAEYFGS